MIETTQERFHVGRIDTRDAVTAAGGQRCRKPLLGRAGTIGNSLRGGIPFSRPGVLVG